MRQVAHEQLNEQTKNDQPKSEQQRQYQTAKDQHHEDESSHYESQREPPSRRHKGDEQAAGHELITKLSQKVVGPTKLKCSCLISAGLTSGRRQLRVKLTSNNRKLIKEVLNCSVTLAKNLLLMNSSK
jgi:protein required for attachment to host cells